MVSKATSRLLPEDVSRVLLRMHAPDRLGFMRDRDVARFGTDEERARAASGGGRHRRLTLRPRSRTSEQQGDEK